MKYVNLSPAADINKKSYFDALDQKLNDEQVKNIAVIGPYGSGKSSVIDSFFKNNQKYKYLHISLANFCENLYEEDENIPPNESDNLEKTDKPGKDLKLLKVDEQKIEEQILQQLFYQIDQSKIPFSGFKKIEHVDNKRQRKTLASIIVWLFTLIFIPGIILSQIENIKEISNRGVFEFWNLIYWPTTIFNTAILGLFAFGLFHFLREVHNTIQKGQIKKIIMKSALVELSEVSALNKHIDEIIYFFEATEKSILIIEDLDRFNSTALFSKLREVNFIINNSPKIKDKKVVKFIYAIKDDVFTKNLNRTKFFDFILPVVPVINVNNSGDQLRKMIGDDAKILGSSFINDISLFIHDMRLLKNIVNEYILFNEVINEDNKKIRTVLFSVVLYKNLFPEEYCKEHKGEGLLKNAFTKGKNVILHNVLKSHNEKLEILKAERKTIIKETVQNEEKLREEYIVEIMKSRPGVYEICSKAFNKIITEESSFQSLFKNPTVSSFQDNYGRKIDEINFDEIQKKVNSEKTYKDRLKILKLRNEGRANELFAEINKEGKAISDIKRKKLAPLVKHNIDNSWREQIFKNSNGKLSPEQDLLLLLLRKGYINESYPIYISYFYEGALTFKDFEFLLNVKNNEGDNFHAKLSKIDELLGRIDEDEYEFEATLNKDLIIVLLNKSDYDTDVRLELLLRQLQKLENVFERIINPLIDKLKDSQKILQRLLELSVIRYYPKIWDAIENQNFDKETKEKYLEMFLFLSEEQIQALNFSSGDDRLKKYLEKKSDFIELFVSEPEMTDAIKLINALELKFQDLTFKRFENNQVFEHICHHYNYELNSKMLQLVLFNENSLEEKDFFESFNTKNFTMIYESEGGVFDYVIERLDTYIKDVFLMLEFEQQETEEALLSLLEKIEAFTKDKDMLIQALSKVSTKIGDLENFGNRELLSLLLDSDCVEPTWVNLIACFEVFDDELNKTIVNWLNLETVTPGITKHKFDYEGFSDQKKDIIDTIMKQILEEDSLKNSSYEKLLSSFPFVFPVVNLNELSQKKVSLLIKLQKIEFNVDNYNQLLNLGFNSMLIEFVIDHINDFIANYSNYDYSRNLHIGLFSSNRVSIGKKRNLIKHLPIEKFSDPKTSLLVSNIFIRSKDFNVEKNIIIQIIINCPAQKKQLQVFDKYFKKFDFSEIKQILKSIGGVYKDASALRARPIWENNKVNLSIAQKLDKNGFFSSVRIDEENDQIRIIVRYSGVYYL